MLEGALLSLMIGLLLGLERERSKRPDEGLFAGIRTFPLLVLAGYLGAAAADHGQPWLLPAVVLAVSGLSIASYVRTAASHVGATTETIAVLAPLLGAFVGFGERVFAASLAVLITLLLTLKAPLHRVAGAVSEDEILAMLKFAVVAVVLLPLLPSQPLGPFGGIAPRHVGLVVVIVSGVSLVGYLLVRVLGGRTGWALVGLVGGLVSSTATTLSLSGKAREVPDLTRPLAAGILLASTVLYARGALLIGVFDAGLAAHLALPLAALFLVGGVAAGIEWRAGGAQGNGSLVLGNPVELGSALLLGLLFAAILLGGRAAQASLGSGGLWLTGALGGLVDVDSVALASARLHQQGLAAARDAGGAYLLATLTNLVAKSGIVVVAGGRSLARRVLPGFGAMAAATLGVLLLG
jgi:uncharacterized membrane protein (DUF4010 family)